MRTSEHSSAVAVADADRLPAWSIRAVQLDLARQMETVSNIIDFARRSSNCGFNTLLLYLEGRVQTESFPYRSADSSYTLSDMQQIVDACDAMDMNVVPCISTLGHAEQFLACSELHHLANPAGKGTFDTASDEVYRFLERYLTELTAVFKSPHLHLGCDEAWPMGQSPGELAQRAEGASYGGVFIEHLCRLHQIAQNLNRRLWLWDDMLEYLSDDEIASIPRDIVWCAWHYVADHIEPDGVQGHFNNLARRDWLKLYEQLGFDVLVAPATATLDSSEALTRWAKNYRIAGGLLTQWELSTAHLPAAWPSVAVTGSLWRDMAQGAPATDSLAFQRYLDSALDELLPQADGSTRCAMQTLMSPQAWPTRYPMNAETLSRHPFGDRERLGLRTAVMLCEVMNKALSQTIESSSVNERRLLREYQIASSSMLVSGRTHRLVDALLDRLDEPEMSDAESRELAWLRTELASLEELRQQDTLQLRPGLSDCCASTFKALRESLDQWVDAWTKMRVENRLLVSVNLFLWDCYSAPQLTLELAADRGDWRTVVDGCRKPTDHQYCQYATRQLVEWTGPLPSRLRATVRGFGGQGIAFVKVAGAGRRLVPDRVLATDGLVADPQHLLIDDSTVTFMGNRNTAQAVIDRAMQLPGRIELSLGETDGRIETGNTHLR